MKSGDKIVLILGNGFDLDLGLKTSYKDFWESEYCPKDYPAPIIKHLNEKWEGKTEGVRWYDLENELIYYYDSIKDKKFYPDIITDKEAEYIKNADIGQLQHNYFGNYYQQVSSLFNKGLIKHYGNYNMLGIPYLEDLRHDSVWRDHNAIKLIKQRLCQYISKANEDGPRTSTISYNILKAMRDCREKGTNVSIYSFNYTPLPAPFDRTLGDSTFHVHGSCHDGNVIIGTREYSEYTSDYDFLQKSFDPFFQPPRIVSDLLAADEVIIFGHSLGENDSQYFKAFFNSQIDYKSYNPKRVYLFTYNDASELELKRAINKLTNYNLSIFQTMNMVKIIKRESITSDCALYNEFLEEHIEKERIDAIISPVQYE